MGKILVIVIILLFTSSLYLKSSFGEATVKNKAQKEALKNGSGENKPTSATQSSASNNTIWANELR